MLVDVDGLALLAGEDIPLRKDFKVRHPKVSEISIFKEEKYMNLISFFCVKSYDLLVELDDIGIRWEDLSNYETFLMLFNKETHKEYFDWIFKGDYNFYLIQNENEELVLFDPDNFIIYDKLLHEEVSSFLRKINFLSLQNEFAPANEFARQLVVDQKRKEKERASRKNLKQKPYLLDIVSFVTWNNTSGMGYTDILNLSIWQLHDGYRRLLKTDNYKNIMSAYYSGNIKREDINFNAIDWTGSTTVNQ